MYNESRSEWSSIQSVIILVITNLITSMITNWIGWHEVLLPVNHNYNINFFFKLAHKIFDSKEKKNIQVQSLRHDVY